MDVETTSVDPETLRPNKDCLNQCRVHRCSIIVFVVAALLALPTYAALLLTLYFAIGQRSGRWGILGLALLSLFILSSVLVCSLHLCSLWRSYRRHARRCHAPVAASEKSCKTQSICCQACAFTGVKQVLCTQRVVCSCNFVFCLLMLTEIFLAIYMPMQSIFPFGMSDALQNSELEERCEHGQKWSEAQAFFASSGIDWAPVRLVVGGAPVNLRALEISAMVKEDTVYLDSACHTSELFAHELVHIWQVQTGWFTLSRSWQSLFSYMSCSACAYDYGGEAGLQRVLQRNPGARITDEFGLEQQAEIVADYFLLSKVRSVLGEPNAAWIRSRLHIMLRPLSPAVLKVLRRAADLDFSLDRMESLIYDMINGWYRTYLLLLETFALQITNVKSNFSEKLGSIDSQEWFDEREETESFQRSFQLIPSLHVGRARLLSGKSLQLAFQRFPFPWDAGDFGWTPLKQQLGGHEGNVTELFTDIKVVLMSFQVNGTVMSMEFPNEAIDVMLNDSQVN